MHLSPARRSKLINNNLTFSNITLTAPGDTNGDGIVNIKDVTPIAVNWLKKVPPAPADADINSDDVINLKDITYIALNWLKKTLPYSYEWRI